MDLMKLFPIFIAYEHFIFFLNGLIQPPEKKLRVMGQRIRGAGKIAHNPLTFTYPYCHIVQHMGQCLGPPENHRHPLCLLVRLGYQPRPLNTDLDPWTIRHNLFLLVSNP